MDLPEASRHLKAALNGSPDRPTDIRALCAALSGYISSQHEVARQARARQFAEYERQVGTALFRLIQEDRDVAVRHLHSASPPEQQCALELLALHHRCIASILDDVEGLALAATDPTTRGLAVLRLSVYHQGSGDRRAGRLLSDIVLSEEEPESLRLMAYRGLQRVAQTSLLQVIDRCRVKSLDDVDWVFVSGWMDE
jgi:hypothetical protein